MTKTVATFLTGVLLGTLVALWVAADVPAPLPSEIRFVAQAPWHRLPAANGHHTADGADALARPQFAVNRRYDIPPAIVAFVGADGATVGQRGRAVRAAASMRWRWRFLTMAVAPTRLVPALTHGAGLAQLAPDARAAE
jgi:hypothetical protein